MLVTTTQSLCMLGNRFFFNNHLATTCMQIGHYQTFVPSGARYGGGGSYRREGSQWALLVGAGSGPRTRIGHQRRRRDGGGGGGGRQGSGGTAKAPTLPTATGDAPMQGGTTGWGVAPGGDARRRGAGVHGHLHVAGPLTSGADGEGTGGGGPPARSSAGTLGAGNPRMG